MSILTVKLRRIVSSHEGIVNKVSLFDKDMMFLVIFGLRGFKHELESRIGLRCASEVHETFKTWPDILTVSIGVTSGMSYCGVVGPTLRREYSVISVAVNKAARLMMAYPDVVSCDQETFLLSKFELKHFTILPKKILKGLRDEVVAYEFKEVYNEMVAEGPVSYNYPIIGRIEIMSMSHSLLMCAISNLNQEIENLEPLFPKVSCLLIKDDSQQGKTRILDELYSRCVRSKVNCIRLNLNTKHSKLSYKVMATVVEKVLRLGGDSNPESIEWIIKKKLERFNVDNFLSALNPIFGLNFEASKIIRVMDTNELSEIKKVMFKILCTQTFQEFSVILIDDFEYLDQQSFELLNCLLETNLVFMFIAMGQQKKLSTEQKSILSKSHVTQYRLQPIDLMFHNQLACYFLNVSAISLELEKYLHKNSAGNPGWIKTNLTALCSTNKVQIKKMTVADVERQGMTMMTGSDPKQELLEAEECTPDEYFMFNQCYYAPNKSIEGTPDQQLLVRVAILEHTLINNEFTMQTRTDSDLMLYDSLTYYEQLVCKCASVLSVEFARHMMYYVMSNSTDRMIGKAMVKLFDLQIFFCASAKESCQSKTSKHKNPSEMIACNCKNVKIFDSCRDLPRYSCCKMLKFRSEGFRRMVYDSLTDKQRLEYHRRSMTFLHMETKKCDACGNGQFQNLMLSDFDFKFYDGIIESDDYSFESMVAYFESINVQIKQPLKKSFIKKLIPFLGKEKTKIRPIVLNYLNYDFRSCKCSLILYSMYSEMINHCHGGETILKLIDSKIELARMSIKVSNIPHASNLLHKALKNLDVS